MTAPSRRLVLAALAALVLTVAACRDRIEEAARGPFEVEDVALDVTAAAEGFVPTLGGPLRVLSATPYGDEAAFYDRQPVSVTFSRPMVSLGETPTPDPAWITVEAADGERIRGDLAWHGTQTLVFTPRSPLPRATAFSARLSAGIPPLDGDPIEEAFEWTFETPRPTLLFTRPSRGDRHVAPRDSLWLHFDQPVQARVAREFVEVTVDGDPEPFRLVQHDDSTLAAVVEGGMERARPYRLTVQEGLTGSAGPLGMAETTEVRFRTYGDLRLERVIQRDLYGDPDTTAFDPRNGVTLEFTNPVRFRDVREAVRLSPQATLPPGAEARDGTVSTSHTLPFRLDPEAEYRLMVRGLEDQFGQTLDEAEASFRTGPYAPSLSMPAGLLVIEADERAAIPVRATNVEAVRVGLRRLTADQIVPALRAHDRRHYYGSLSQGASEPEPIAADRRYRIPLGRNRPGTVPLGLQNRLNEEGTGVVAVHMESDHLGRNRDGSPREWSTRALAQVTRLGITAKFSPHQQLVLVTTLADAEPVRGVEITLRDLENQVLWRGETDRSGRAEVPGWEALGVEKADRWEPPALFAIAERGGDVTFTSSLYNDGLEPYRFDVWGDWAPEPSVTSGAVFSDRGLYRAGETVHLKGILRTKTDADWRPTADSVRVVVRSPRDEVVLDRRLVPSRLGGIDLDWEAPADADQGAYRVRVAATSDTTIADRWSETVWADGSFRVESFRRATFAVTPSTPAEAYVAGDFFEGTIEGRYLFGAPMGGQPVRYSLTRYDGAFAPQGFDAFRFGPLEWDYGGGPVDQGEGVLDAEGAISRRVYLEGNENGQPMELIWEGTVTDPARQEQSGTARIALHPALFYVGLRVGTTYLDVSERREMPVDIVTLDPNGAPVGDEEVTIELVREQWNSVREMGTDGRLRWRSEKTEEVVGRQRVTPREGRMARLSLPVADGGAYVVRATSRDVRGNAVRTDARFYAAGGGYSAWERTDDDRIELVPEKTAYAPGETARLLVQSPFERATALVTVEREGVISSRVVELVGTAPQIEVELTERHLPNAFVSVVLLSGRTARPGRDADPGAPQFRMGMAELRVDPGLRRLRVEVEPDQEEYRPGEEVTVALRLVDSRGRGVPGEIAFSAADAGVLNLISYALPDPFETFYGPRPLGVRTAVTLSDLVRQRNYGQKEEDLGGGGGDPDDLLRRDFRPQAHWDPAVQTDRRGRAEVTFKLPESLTTFRLMAAAHTEDSEFGNGSADVTVSQPLVLTPALPRFGRLGDTFEAGVLVSNRTEAAGEVVVRAEAAEGLALQGSAGKRLTLRPGQTREVRFGWEVTRAASSPREVRFTAQMGSERDGLAVPLPIARPTSRTVTATFSSTDGQAREALTVPADALPGLGGLRASVASTALVGLDGAARYLFEYPYGCLEQTTSRVRPLLVGRDLLQAYDLAVLDGRDPDRVVQGWLSELDEYWAGDGFALWKGGTHANPYVTAYATLALAEAEAAGYDVPEDLARQAVEAVVQRVRERSDRPVYYNEGVWADTRALMLFALARHGRVLAPEIDALARDGELSTEGASVLLRTIVAARERSLNRHRQPLLDRLRSRLRVEATTAYLDAPDGDDWGWIFSSDARATAYALAALVQADPSEDTRQLGQRMVRYLMQDQAGGHWASTQENAAVVDAFRVFAQQYERETPSLTAEVAVAGRRLLRESFQGRSLSVREAERSLSDLTRGQQAPVTISATGSGRAYYQIVLETFSAEPQPARSQGLQVARSIQPLDDRGEAAGPALSGADATLRAGQLVRVTVRLRSPTSRSYVVVDDGLPAGLEAINTAFSSSPAVASAQSGQSRWWGSFNHTEIRDDRVLLFADYLGSGEHTYSYLARATTPGTFVHPPVQAEAMYTPEIMARTATGRLLVTP